MTIGEEPKFHVSGCTYPFQKIFSSDLDPIINYARFHTNIENGRNFVDDGKENPITLSGYSGRKTK